MVSLQSLLRSPETVQAEHYMVNVHTKIQATTVVQATVINRTPLLLISHIIMGAACAPRSAATAFAPHHRRGPLEQSDAGHAPKLITVQYALALSTYQEPNPVVV